MKWWRNTRSDGEKNYKYILGYKDGDYKIKPVPIMLPKMSAYVKSYDGETTWKNFLIKDDDLLKKYVWNKVSTSIEKEWLWTHLYWKKLWKTKIRSCNDETTDFQSRKIPKAGSNYICWSGIIMDSVLK